MRWPALVLAAILALGGPGVLRAEKKTLYICPMHPSYRSDRPGKCPICGMDLVPLQKEAPPVSKAPSQERPVRQKGLPLAPVEISPERVQLIGVRTARVTHERVVLTYRAPARVTYDEERLRRVHLRVAGWVEEVRGLYTGARVHRGEVLFTLYAPEVLATEEEWLRAAQWVKRLEKEKASPEVLEEARQALRSAERRLLLWGFDSRDLARVRARGRPLRALPVRAPAGGYVVENRVFPGKRLRSGETAYVLADLSEVWVEADLYQDLLREIRPGLPVEVRFPGLRKAFSARVKEILPWVEERLRVGRVRLALRNPEGLLRPGLWAEATFRIPLGMRMLLPEEALIYGGEHYYVFVRAGLGHFEPREVKVGPRVGEKRVVLSGVRHGEEVVVSANFLIDAESRLKAALESFSGGGGGHHHH
ncbi:efflux RND transporter periplasmic adaptor subunit [Thermosulfurimonas marina]|uniref:Efflux RND transporter periplasmic adaptor subunit n=1 Tax=Thermosulfurimonas marina TaxID=2047767 RepID=A0A6H1WSL7_9BACT|nr:efflux RND transporter periplasmic adaptor subunit [Thermosulfurimonas marina]QJA06193.1 efflux RND transporter periplasmic adaptor subunit [Thermosulfurimonas marina]